MKQNHLLLLLAMFSSGWLAAQESVVASGGSGSGTGGSTTYSIGQVAYTEISGSSGFAIQGVQQPYEIYELDVKEDPAIKFEAIVYPNPTREDITLKIVTVDGRNFGYELFDMHGRLLIQNTTTGIETFIPLDRFEAGSYILKVLTEKSVLKIFKIIKR